MTRPRPVVAIDGPAGAGKSTVAKGVAAALGYTLVDTGSLYRAVALVAKGRGVALDDRDGVERAAREAVATGELRLGRAEKNVTRVLIAGEDPGDRIRTPEMSMGASAVSAYPGVREALLDAQRQFGAEGAVVLEGRDIGTVVFPDAEVKVFLTASAAVRARRRCDELTAKGVAASYEETLADVEQRDRQDASRAIAPLRQAEDATLVDSSAMAPAEVIEAIAAMARAKDAGPR
ncbi:MAG: (d)CMP kinase [Polyangiales bacterium]